MPRQAHGRPVQAGKPKRAPEKKSTRQNRRLNALQIAEQENPDEVTLPQHRLGQVEDDSDDPRSRADADERSSKRRKIADRHDDESAEEGSDLEGNRWHVGVDDEEEDSDIDSDDAFGESDEERFADYTFRGSTQASSQSKKRPRLDVSSGEEGDDNDDEQSDDDLGEEAVDLATAWDMDDRDEDSAPAGGKRKKGKSAQSASTDSDEDEERSLSESDEEGDIESDLSVSEDEGDHSKLQDFVQGLTTDRTPKRPTNKRALQNLPDRPSQFGLGSSKLSAADLLQYIKDPRQRQALKILQSNGEKGSEVYKGGIPGKLAPPLAKRQQDRLDRAAAYDESKKTLARWIDTVKQNRRAEHLSFPLVDPNNTTAAANEKQLGPTSQSQPMTTLESAIDNILMESGMVSSSKQNRTTQDDQEQAFEELQEKHMPLAEVQARRAELRQARDLMFREEIRARRIKKIKSKAYRRVHRKERERAKDENRSLLAAQGLIDSEEERERNDRRRAEERMGARHKESKWAKGVKAAGRTAWDDDARHAVTDLARRDEELRRRIEGKRHKPGSDDGSASDSSESENDFYSASDDDQANKKLEVRLDALSGDDLETIESRLNSMAFMKRAEAARKAANDQEIQELRRTLQDGESGPIDGTGHEEAVPAGRQKFGSRSNDNKATTKPPTRVDKSEFEERESEDERGDEAWRPEAIDSAMADGASRLMARGAKSEQRTKASGSVIKESPARVQPQAILQTARSKKGKDVLLNGGPLVKQSHTSASELDEYAGFSDPASEGEGEGDDRAALAQAIFAGPDEVAADFAKEKREAIEDEGDQVVDNSLPGWGSWAGEGISKKAQKRAKGKGRQFLTTVVKGVAADKRQDAKLDRVIVNEKRVKKNGKYLATELPHPFETRAQYERSMRLPLGPEWTTKSTFQDGTKPRVLLKQGIIRPMARPVV